MDPIDRTSVTDERPAPALAKFFLAAAPFAAILILLFLESLISR